MSINALTDAQNVLRDQAARAEEAQRDWFGLGEVPAAESARQVKELCLEAILAVERAREALAARDALELRVTRRRHPLREGR